MVKRNQLKGSGDKHIMLSTWPKVCKLSSHRQSLKLFGTPVNRHLSSHVISIHS